MIEVFRNQQPSIRGFHRISSVRRILLFLPWIGFIWQSFLSSSSVDVISSFLAASGSFLCFFDAFRPQRLYRYPFSTLVVLGFAVTLNLGPLLFTAIEGNSITYNLNTPIATFGHGVLAVLVSLLAHAAYRKAGFLTAFQVHVRRVLFQLKLFQPLNFVHVILMGALGLFALSVTSWFANIGQNTIIIEKLLQGFQFFSIIPAAFLLKGLLEGRTTNTESSFPRKSLILFVFYMALVVILSLGRNSRGIVVMPFACLFLGLALEWLYGLIKITRRSILSFGLVILLVVPLATDFATAMVMVRGQRSVVSTAELFSLTINQWLDFEDVRKYRLFTYELGLTRDWSESYVSNIFLSRFSNAKFPDNSLLNSKNLSSDARVQMTNFQTSRLLAILPQPILSLFGVQPSLKDAANSVSYGDTLYYLASGRKSALGGFRTGHFFGTGMASLDFGYTFILFLGLLLIFPLVDAHALVSASNWITSPLLSVVSITQIFRWFTFSNSESVFSLFAFALRDYVQPIILYCIVRWVVSKRFVL